MNDHRISFFTFDEAVEAARSAPGAILIGLNFVEPFSYLNLYIVIVDPDEPNNVNIAYEGGELFSACIEEEFFTLSDVPIEAKSLFYAHMSDLSHRDAQVIGMGGEFVLQEVLPGLKKHAHFRDHVHFKKVAGSEFNSYWRKS